MRRSLAGPKNERSGPEKGRRAARPDSGLWGRESGQAGLLTRAFSRQRSASLRSLRAAADAPIVSQRPERGHSGPEKGNQKIVQANEQNQIMLKEVYYADCAMEETWNPA